MNAIYPELAERIRGEAPDLERVIQRAMRAWAHVQRAPDEQEAYLDSVALNLHGFYSGLERLFELIARHVDRALPTGETWHRDLLEQMTHETEDRPAVVNRASALALDEFRRFRHIVRNVYTMNLSPDKVAGLMAVLPELWPRLRAELLALADFLEQLANEAV
jgi:hypothetical protein